MVSLQFQEVAGLSISGKTHPDSQVVVISPIVPNARLRLMVVGHAILRCYIPLPNAVKAANAIESTHTMIRVYRQRSVRMNNCVALVAKALFELVETRLENSYVFPT